MKRLIFKCTFLQDVILTAHSVSEGIPDTLDFIPGSNFLGIVAGSYREFEENGTAYDIFHSGKVRFGDAHLALKNQKSFKAPLSWFIAKGDSIESPKWVHHGLTQTLRDEFVRSYRQLKQVRNGWITPDCKHLNVNTNFAIKSAYDRNERKSKDGQMYGYKSLSAGSEWIFYVDMDNSLDCESIVNKLTGKKHIGRSRSAQYGSVEIRPLNKSHLSLSTEKLFNNQCLIIYAESRLAFFNQYGQMTLQPEPEAFNLSEDWQIIWDLCQVNNQIFAPFNGKNKNYEADRVCFEKGSVFVFKNNGNAQFDIKKIESGLGGYLNEGFGQVIVNPNFLATNEKAESVFKINTSEKEYEHSRSIVDKDSSDEALLSWISNESEIQNNEKKTYRDVARFAGKYKNKFNKISPSQWGQIRAIATEEDTFDDMMNSLFLTIQKDNDGKVRSQDRSKAGFLEHGKMASKWKKGKDTLKSELENHRKYGTEYAVRLATQMQKISKKGAVK